MPNIIGILSERPERVIPVASHDSEGSVKSLIAAISAAGFNCQVDDPVIVMPYSLDDCVKEITELMNGHVDLTVNWTGGTKIMSFAARRAAEISGRAVRAIYVNTAGREILVEENLTAGQVMPRFLDSTTLGLNTLVHVTAAGHSVEGGATLKAFREAHTPAKELQHASELLLDAPAQQWAILNSLASGRNGPAGLRGVKPELLQSLILAKVIENSAQGYLIGSETLGRPFHRNTPQDENSKFIRGGYIEIFVWSQLNMRGAFDDVAWHLLLNPGQLGRISEFDVVVASEGRLLVIECKGRVELNELKDLIEETSASTKRLGRLFGRWLLYIHQSRSAFTQPNADQILASQEARAADFGGQIVWLEDLGELPQRVSDTVEKIRSAL